MGCKISEEDKPNKYQHSQRHNRYPTIDLRRKETKLVDVINENIEIISETLSTQQISFCMHALKKHQLFHSLTYQELHTISESMTSAKGQQNNYIFHQGEVGHSFFVIQKGTVSVEMDNKTIARLKEGQCFGELALLCRTKRSASIKCQTQQVHFFVMKPKLYHSILTQLRSAEYSFNKETIQRIALFQCLTNKQKYNLAHFIKRVNFKKGATIFNIGQVATGIYIVSEGQIQINIPGQKTLKIGQLEMFGESALKEDCRRKGTARCVEDSVCLVIGKKDISSALGGSVNNLMFFNKQKWALLQTQTFKNYNNNEINKIIMGFSCLAMQDGEKMQGSCYRGIVISLQGGINDKPEGSMFNFKHWQKGQEEGEDLIKNGTGHIGYISFDKLNEIIEQIDEKKSLFKASQKCIEVRDEHLSLSDFELVRKLGAGQFGQVFLVRSKKTGGGLYAVKCLSKSAVISQQMEQSVIEQKRVLEKAIFPFIVGYVKTFHDKTTIFLLMEYLKGKQMFDVIRQMPTLNKPIARYFFGCILLSIQYLHANNIIYRDIKPQNSVIDHEGKVHLIDLGTAKELKSSNLFKTFTIIGTPHYMAPEVFEGKGYSFEADLWSLGILFYEFICGKLPFGEKILDDPFKIYKAITRSHVEFPKYVQDQKAKALIKLILLRDPKVRSEQVSFSKIKKHQFYEGFDWEALLSQKMIPPYIPRDFRLGDPTQDEPAQQLPFLDYFHQGKKHGTVTEWNQQF